jgi:hypothetical protein
MQTASVRARLTSAAAAIGVQLGIAALLVVSFAVVRQVSGEKETILYLPPLLQQRPQPQSRKPVVIDARPHASTAPPPAAATPPLPAWATPGFALGTGQNGIVLAPPPGVGDCKPENYGQMNASARARCPPLAGVARADPNTMPLNPNKPVPNAKIWQAEVDRRNAPVGLPGASGGLIGMLGTLLFNPGAYLDKRSYSYVPPQADVLDGAETTHRAWSQIPQCNGQLDDTTRRNCAFNVGATMMSGGGEVYPDHPHVSETAFQQALAATQARTRVLYGKPVIASGKTGGGDAQTHGPDTGGVPAVAGGGTGR